MLFITLYKLVLTFSLWMKSIHLKTIEQYFPVVLFITLYKVAISFESADEIFLSVTMKDSEQDFLLVLFVILYKVVLPFESVDEMCKVVLR